MLRNRLAEQMGAGERVLQPIYAELHLLVSSPESAVLQGRTTLLSPRGSTVCVSGSPHQVWAAPRQLLADSPTVEAAALTSVTSMLIFPNTRMADASHPS